MARGDVPLLIDKNQREPAPASGFAKDKPARADKFDNKTEGKFQRAERSERAERPARPERTTRPAAHGNEPGKASFRIEVGHAHGVKPGNIVGAIANEAGMDAKYIGRIEIHDDHSTLDLPDDMPPDLIDHLKTVWVAGQQLRITHAGEEPDRGSGATAQAPGQRKSPFAKKTGGDRRFEEKNAPRKAGAPFKHKADAGKTSPKPHRKGAKPA
jgi:ATP-dependent RNA helicase DeaD